VPWYYTLEGDIRKAQTFWDYFTVWRVHWTGQLVMHNVMRVMEWVGALPKGTLEVVDAMKVAIDGLVGGGKLKVVNSPSFTIPILTVPLDFHSNVFGCRQKTQVMSIHTFNFMTIIPFAVGFLSLEDCCISRPVHCLIV
jgi:hypothetical protein